MSQNPDNSILVVNRNVPQSLAFILFLLFGFIYQSSNAVYLSMLGELSSAQQFQKEDLMLAFQTSLIGLCISFPILFRVRFRFTSYQILITCTLVTLLMMLISACTTSLPVLIIANLIMGFFKMIGTFESLANIQLKITPTRDLGIFYNVIYTIVLISIQVTGLAAVYLTQVYNWQIFPYIMIAVLVFQLLIQIIILKPVRLFKKIPLYGIDWKGMFLWSIFFLTIAFIAYYGQEEDWLNSRIIIGAIVVLAIIIGLLYINILSSKRNYLNPTIFKYKNIIICIVMNFLLMIFLNTSGSILSPFTAAVMKLDSINTINLNLWIGAGIVSAHFLCSYWYRKVNKSFRIVFATGFLAMTLYHFLIYLNFSSLAGQNILWLPYFLRGFGQLILYVGVNKFMMRGLGFEYLPHALFSIGIIRTAVGAPIATSIITQWEHHEIANQLNKLVSRVDSGNNIFMDMQAAVSKLAEKGGASSLESKISATSAIYHKFHTQAVLLAGKEIFGWVSLLGFVAVFLVCVFPFSSSFIKRFPSWQQLRNLVARESRSI
jgi:DHA2 family multidrug resistance protein